MSQILVALIICTIFIMSCTEEAILDKNDRPFLNSEIPEAFRAPDKAGANSSHLHGIWFVSRGGTEQSKDLFVKFEPTKISFMSRCHVLKSSIMHAMLETSKVQYYSSPTKDGRFKIENNDYRRVVERRKSQDFECDVEVIEGSYDYVFEYPYLRVLSDRWQGGRNIYLEKQSDLSTL